MTAVHADRREKPAELLARVDLAEVIESYGVTLKKKGRELVACCPFHSESTPSFTVTPEKQRFYCFGCQAGGDALTFVQEITGCTFGEAMEALGAREALPTNPATRTPTRPADDPPEWIKGPAPATVDDPPATLRIMRGGEWTEAPVVARWAYHDADGQLVGYTCRVEFERPDGTRAKDVLPLTWQTNTRTGEQRWRMGAFDAPRPLYGAELLAASPGAAVIVVEGEKAADAARRMFPGRLVVTWPGGCKAVERADWTPLAGRKVVLWPDADAAADRAGETLPYAEQPGMRAMLAIADRVADLGGTPRVWRCPEPGQAAPGWDAADAEAEGIAGADMLERLRAGLATAEEIRAPASPEPEHPTKRERKPRPPRAPSDPPAERPTDADPIRALGYDRGRYYYMPTRQRQVLEYSKGDHTTTGLLQLAPLAYWEQAWASGGEMKREHWTAAVDALMRRCERAGIFDPVILRGRGCWSDEGRVVFNLGNRALVDGREESLETMRTRFIYEAGPRLAGPAVDPLPVDQSRRVLDIARRFHWEMPASAALLAGWIVLAPVCGALRWRPHVWLTGGAGTGKTTILGDFVAPLLAGTELQVQGNSTEAGIRQALRADARPVLFDESEQNNEREEARVQAILSLIRQSSSESQSRTLKGTTTGRSMDFHVRSMFALSSIQVGIQRQADHSRISVLGLVGTGQVSPERAEAMRAAWIETQRLLVELRQDEAFAGRLLARTVAMWPTIEANARTITRVAAEVFNSQRLADQYGTLLAGTAALLYDHEITEAGARNLIDSFEWAEYQAAAREDESGEALASIMQIPVMLPTSRGGRDERTVGELVRVCAEGLPHDGVEVAEAVAILGRLGLKVKRSGFSVHGLLVANKSERLAEALRGRPWAADWKSYLRRLPGAVNYHMPVTFAWGYNSRATLVPLECLRFEGAE